MRAKAEDLGYLIVPGGGVSIQGSFPFGFAQGQDDEICGDASCVKTGNSKSNSRFLRNDKQERQQQQQIPAE
jgi:hypothetical protein